MRSRPTLALLSCPVLGVVLLGACGPAEIPDFATWPVNSEGYEIERLPIHISASFARGDDVYLGEHDAGAISKVSDGDLSRPWISLGRPLDVGPRLLFASSSGILLASADCRPVYRSSDEGQTWTVCLDVPVWRMDEDDQGNLYAGDYIKDTEHVATVYKSNDGGISWAEVYRDPQNHHVHTVRWDERGKRLYISTGDGRVRRHLFSDDRGATFHVIVEGLNDGGHTDVAFASDYVFWCTDDGTGRVLRADRHSGQFEALLGRSQFVWFGVAQDEQLYVGTVTSRKRGGERAALLASDNQGNTWQKLLETAVSTGPYGQGFYAESRQLSTGGWLYCTGGDESGPVSYRVRRKPQ